MLSDIAFSDYKKDDIHGVALYPATMVAPVQKKVLKYLFEHADINSIFDPFHGSGTALYEAASLDNNIELYGCDINPLANLITKVKLKGVSDYIFENISLLEKYISNDNIEEFGFRNIDKWFRADIKRILTKIRFAIIRIKENKDRLFFWCILSSFIRKYSNTRNETFKLHIKKDESISRIKNNLIENFLSTLRYYAPMFKCVNKDPYLYKEDVLENFLKFNDNSIDLLISSPPYGDNLTTVTYGQFSSLSLYWIDPNDLELDGWELNSYSAIDSNSLGKSRRKNNISYYGINLLDPYLRKIDLRKQKKVINFFDDYFKFLDEICRITKKYIVLTLGNRTVDGVQINLKDITQNYLVENGFKNEFVLNRKILNKRIPNVTSSVNNKAVPSMNKEYVLIHQKSVCSA